MALGTIFRARIEAAAHDSELRRNSPHLNVRVRFDLPDDPVTLHIVDGKIALVDGEMPEIVVTGEAEGWDALVAHPQPPLHNSFTALQIANPSFEVSGDAETIGRARAALDRLVECLAPVAPAQATPTKTDHRQISGRYARVATSQGPCQMFYEVAGQGDVPLVFLHTAGADARQYLEQMADTELASRFTLFAPDMPFHGRTMPPDGWDGGPYHLTAEIYRDWVTAFIEGVVGSPAVLVGGSMGAAIALVMAAERPALTRAVIALEPPYRSKGRRNPHQDHVGIHAGLHNSAFTRGLMSPTSPLHRRRLASWIYTQGAPGIYRGDLAFYSEEFDGGEIGPQIDAARTPVALLSGTYDFSATPEDGARLAKDIPGALHLVMNGLGHFPATEHPELFRPFLMQALDHVAKNHDISQ
ncbi:alpha/beta fold hydrolase [Sulfitobacter sp. W074]|uniref:alpha/beta fold hydrolase n=1 Tax=Sulfitobacter sp. W074 TaxID=2867026 RepID=UPI0021A42DDF|nr:alpha/beta hydrolase [Sulfitobacter sp. W074]UWR38473.1 alpha/beta hydrolase [Sulfitobacter sp. W074]